MAGDFQEQLGESSQNVAWNSGSISFGRFEKEELSWEKRSLFSHNKYIEEAGKYSKPGSVVEKKAYFEAHFKKKGILFPGASLSQNSNENLYRSTNISEVDDHRDGNQEVVETNSDSRFDDDILANNDNQCKEDIDSTDNNQEPLSARGQLEFGSDIVSSVDNSHSSVSVVIQGCQQVYSSPQLDQPCVSIETQEKDMSELITNSDKLLNEVSQVEIQQSLKVSECLKPDQATSSHGKSPLGKSNSGTVKRASSSRLNSLQNGNQIGRNVNKHETKVSSGNLKFADRRFVQPAISEEGKITPESSSSRTSGKGPNSGKVLSSNLIRDKSYQAGKRLVQTSSSDKPETRPTDERSRMKQQLTEADANKFNRSVNIKPASSSQPGPSGVKGGSSFSRPVGLQRRESCSKTPVHPPSKCKGTESRKGLLGSTSGVPKISREAGAAIKRGNETQQQKARIQTGERVQTRTNNSRMKMVEPTNGAGSSLNRASRSK